MPDVKRLAPGVDGVYIRNARFKTSRVSVYFYLPLRKETLSRNALLPYLLTSGCKAYPDFGSLQSKLDSLYGAALSGMADKAADSQVLRITLSALDDKYALGGESVSAACAELLRQLIFYPAVEKGAFDAAVFQREKRLFIERIEGEINEKRIYAKNRCLSEMCAGEPFGLPRLGAKEDAEALTAADAYAAWEEALDTAYVRVSVVSASEPDAIFAAFADAFSARPRREAHLAENTTGNAPQTVRQVTDRLDVAQGKLVMGFRTGEAGPLSGLVPLMIFTDVFGGGPYSRLFANVREKLSLCYYCAARVNYNKGILTVESGVESQNAKKAEDEILRQLDIMRAGEFSDEELAASKLAKGDMARSILDTPAETEVWYASQVFDPRPLSPAQTATAIQAVTREQVIEAARKIRLDTVYTLLPKEEAAHDA